MRTFTCSQRLLTGALLLFCTTASSATAIEPAPPQPEDAFKESAVRATDSAVKRDSQPTIDPWTASSTSALFSRPARGESFKFSSEASTTGTVLSLGFTPGPLWAPNSASLANLQVIAGYSIGDDAGSVSLKWAVPFSDPRFFSQSEMTGIAKAGGAALAACLKDPKVRADDSLETCRKRKDDAIDAEIELIRPKAKTPGLSLGASVGYGFSTRRLERMAANVAYERKLWTNWALILNADLESGPEEVPDGDVVRVERIWRTGGSTGLAWKAFAKTLENKLELSAAAQVRACLQQCGGNTVSVKFGPQANYALSSDTLLGVTASWSGESTSLREAVLGVAVSHSIGLAK
ncbi:hypothetical protein [Corallococcus terminator]|uniref:Uncharacterized protein n=1 Tax=Corallococcus terminator TaxID=2316733 RepID=A0A3A8J1W3_9BACT|nr:hypothetical protein [Corallococcus terminator]RKG86194.1 hypothetical protein D7V88_18345 [Corallococcus terminator]